MTVDRSELAPDRFCQRAFGSRSIQYGDGQRISMLERLQHINLIHHGQQASYSHKQLATGIFDFPRKQELGDLHESASHP